VTDRLSPQREAEISERLAEARHLAAEADWPLEEYQTIKQQQTDASALLAELAAVRAERDEAQRKLDARTEDVAFLERNTLPDLHRQIQHHQDGKKRWRDRAEKAEAEVTRMTLAEPELCSWCGHVEAAHSKDGSIDCNASGAEVAQRHQCPCTFFIPGGAR
jgi:uncharacterized coiled-coil DUF342 family protein